MSNRSEANKWSKSSAEWVSFWPESVANAIPGGETGVGQRQPKIRPPLK